MYGITIREDWRWEGLGSIPRLILSYGIITEMSVHPQQSLYMNLLFNRLIHRWAIVYKLSFGNIFSCCTVWNEVINHLSGKYHFIPPHQCDDLYNYMRNWTYRFSKYSVCFYLLFFAMWTIWKAKNSFIFEGKKLTILTLFSRLKI